MDLESHDPALSSLAAQLAASRRKGVPRHDGPPVKRYYEAATIVHLAGEEQEVRALAEAAQAAQAAISWDYMDVHLRFLRLVYLGVLYPPADEAAAALALALELAASLPEGRRAACLATGRLFYMQDQEEPQHRNMAGALLQVLDVMAAATTGQVLLNQTCRDLLAVRVVAEDLGPLENQAGAVVRAYRFQRRVDK